MTSGGKLFTMSYAVLRIYFFCSGHYNERKKQHSTVDSMYYYRTVLSYLTLNLGVLDGRQQEVI